jgi:hypothetical protein
MPAQPKRAIDFSALRKLKIRLYLWSVNGIGPSPTDNPKFYGSQFANVPSNNMTYMALGITKRWGL